jgi:hypothetical protein
VTNRIVTTVGSSVTYQIVIGNPGANPTLDFYDAAPLPDGLVVNQSSGRITGKSTTAGTTSPVTLTSGNYLYLDPGTGNPITVTTNITIVVNPAGGNTAPSIGAAPKSLIVTQGLAATFSVTASGTPAPTYEWRKDGQKINGATGVTFTIPSAQPSDEAGYTVVASNSAGSVTSSPPATLTVLVPPSITTQPLPVTVNSGSPASFRVVATGKPAPAYQWQKNGKDIGGATTDTYSLPAAQPGDEGLYTVVVSNGVGQPVTSTGGLLTVQVAPAITTAPVPVTVDEGVDATFTVVATGKPAPGFQWKKGVTPIGGETSTSLVIHKATAADEGDYSVEITNAAGSVTTTPVHLTVNAAPPTEVKLTHVALADGVFSFDANCPATMKCQIWRTDDLVVWTLDDTLVPSNGTVHYSVQIPAGSASRAFKAVVTP